MVRPRHCRRVRFKPNCDYFKPRGIGLSELKETNLKVEELEAIRLKDFQKLDQIDAARKMNVSQSTFHRILFEARSKIANALVNGKAIKIHGGVFKMPNKDGMGPEGKGPRTGRGLGNCQQRDDEQLDTTRPKKKGMGPCGNGTSRGEGRGNGGGWRN